MKDYFIAENSIVEDGVTIGKGTKIWYFSHIRKGVIIGENCTIGDYVFIDEDVIIGNNVKIGNGTFLPKGTTVKDNVRIGPNVVFHNVRQPKPSLAGEIRRTCIHEGVTILGNATIAAGIDIGVSAQIAEGAIVISNISASQFVAGTPDDRMNKFFREKVKRILHM